MAQRCKGLNSKCFLFTYLVIVGFLLVLWINRLPLIQKDQREIPADIEAYITSPPRLIPPFSLEGSHQLTLTNNWFQKKWSFVYFTHSHCLPECRQALEYMGKLQSSFASIDFNFLMIGIDGEHETAGDLAVFLGAKKQVFTVATASDEIIELLAKSFTFLFLRTNFTNGNYQIEQEHSIFLVDPKGRVYATFMPPYSSKNIQQQFLKLRSFYARSE